MDETTANQHPRAAENNLPGAHELYKEVTALAEQWTQESLPLSERTIIKDRLRYINDRCEWISNEEQRQFVQKPIDELWQKIIHTN